MSTDIIVHRDVDIPMPDGVVLRADVYRPAVAAPSPVLLRRTPYRKEGWEGFARGLASAGYVVVVQDLRGRGRSQGDFVWSFAPEAQDIEARDGASTVGWCAEQEWSDGSVGTWGHSYDGWSQLRTAVLQPPALKAMHVAGITGRFLDMTRGILDIGRRMEWCYTLGQDLAGRAISDSDMPVDRNRELVDRWVNFERGKWLWFLPLAELPPHALTGASAMFQSYLDHTSEEVWDFDSVLERIQVPTSFITGWWDRFSEAASLYARLVEATGSDRHRLLIGPWSHHPETFGPDLGDVSTDGRGGIDYVAEMVAWFDQELKGRPQEVPPVRYFTVGANEWRSAEAWPPASRRRRLFAHSTGTACGLPFGDGRLSAAEPAEERPDVYRYDPRDPVMSLMLQDAHHAPKDQAPNDTRADVAHFETEALDEPVEVTGTPVVRLWASSDGYDTDWVVRLLDVAPDGAAVNMSSGILRARYRGGYDVPEMLVPGQPTLFEIPLSVISHAFGVGHRLRLDVTSSDFPNYDRNHNTGLDDAKDPTLRVATQTILHDREHATAIELPVAGSEGGLW
jgi:putative CocE/NonD family hydrolase